MNLTVFFFPCYNQISKEKEGSPVKTWYLLLGIVSALLLIGSLPLREFCGPVAGDISRVLGFVGLGAYLLLQYKGWKETE